MVNEVTARLARYEAALVAQEEDEATSVISESDYQEDADDPGDEPIPSSPEYTTAPESRPPTPGAPEQTNQGDHEVAILAIFRGGREIDPNGGGTQGPPPLPEKLADTARSVGIFTAMGFLSECLKPS